MILEIDMGNTRIKWRLREESRSVARGSHRYGDDFEALTGAFSDYKSQVIERILVASVVSAARNQALIDWAKNKFEIVPEFAVPQAVWHGIVNGYRSPERLGVDRWLAVLASYQRAHGPCVVVDCGSAITVDLIDAEGVHQGGYIAPGLMMMRSSLARDTHAVGATDTPNPQVFNLEPGCDTQSAVNGALAAMVTGLVQQAMQRLTSSNHTRLSPRLYITGGDAGWLAYAFPGAQVVPDLVFEGLGLAFCAG